MQPDILTQSEQAEVGARSIPELCDLAAIGLVEMLDPERRIFCNIYNRTENGMSRQGLSPRYTMMTLLGLHRYEQSGRRSPVATAPVLDALLVDPSWVGSAGDLGLLLWTCAELVPERLPQVYEQLGAQGALERYTDGRQGCTMEVAWYLTGIANCYLAGHANLPGLDEEAVAARHILERNCGASGVYGHLSRSGSLAGCLRGRIGTFADQVYSTIAFARLSQVLKDEKARRMALRTAEKMCELQGPLGEWSWHYDSVSGRAVSRYPVYSVHQHAMGPMMLFAVEEAAQTDFNKAVSKSLDWISGKNELGYNLVEPELGLIWRCFHLSPVDAYADAALRFLQLRSGSANSLLLKTRFECRPYELGWLLYAFAGRSAKKCFGLIPNTQEASGNMDMLADITMSNETYVLITAAHNEEQYIEGTIRSILGQSVQPLKWLIVSDASTDRTNEIVKKYAGENALIELVQLDVAHRHSFGRKSHAIMTGYNCLKGLEYGFIGILDADISLQPDYYTKLLNKFREDPKLGLTGGFIHEERRGVFTSRRSNRTFSVAGATQFFRRECFEGIGGILSLRYGGADWCAEVSARMMGWDVRAIPELKVFHHRTTGTANNLLRHRFQEGKKDFSLGVLPTFEVVKCIGRLVEKPPVIGGLARLAGFVWSYCIREERPVSQELVEFLRTEQKRRLFSIFN
jgi:glycosyltransferase involved in cell wall biosynthesis